MQKLRGLIFDLDGTLVDSAPDLCQAMNKTLTEHGRRPVMVDELKTFTGDGMLAQVQRAFDATGKSLSNDDASRVFQNFVGHYRSLKADRVQIYPHVTDVLESFVQKDIKLGLCTNKTEGSTLKLLDELKLLHYFSFIAGGDTFPVHKPDPGHVRGVIKGLEIVVEGCVMIGDSANDVLAAQGAGIPCIVTTHGYGLDVSGLGADMVINGLHEIEMALGKLGFSSVVEP